MRIEAGEEGFENPRRRSSGEGHGGKTFVQ